jgi:nucleoside 2-deoxyribosyltransferase
MTKLEEGLNIGSKQFLSPPDREIIFPHPHKQVYLAGPITGLSYGVARHGWRQEFADLLSDAYHIKLFSPMRGKDFLAKETALDGTPNMYMDNPMATKKGIVARDRYDVKRCDLMVANFLGAEIVSIGTCIEFGWADAFDKPIIMVIDEENIHQHAMLDEVSGFIVTTLEEAADIARVLLTPGV